eukprot:gene25504-biopygen10654
MHFSPAPSVWTALEPSIRWTWCFPVRDRSRRRSTKKFAYAVCGLPRDPSIAARIRRIRGQGKSVVPRVSEHECLVLFGSFKESYIWQL